MNAMFGSLTTEGLEEAQDRVGGFQPFNSDIYSAEIKAAYAGQSEGGARSVTIIAEIDNREYRETIYITDKTGKNYFLNKSDKTKKVPLPGFTTIDDICLITTEQPLAQQDTEKKVVKVYDYDAKKEVPKEVDMLIHLIGKPVDLGIIRQMENKSVKQGADYVPTAETREVNFIDKVFHPELKVTVVEAKNGVSEATFYNSWRERNQGNTRDKRTIKDGEASQAGRPGSAPQAGAAAPKKSLFATA